MEQKGWIGSAPEQGRRLRAVGGRMYFSVAGEDITSQAHNPHQQWVLLRSLQTNTFVAVEPPPHEEAMGAHGRSDSISLSNIFSFFRGGYIWARATDSLLNVCTEAREICSVRNLIPSNAIDSKSRAELHAGPVLVRAI
ncbi:MAG: hypothetical protein SGPRY_008422 [Prymnesium sp.]